MDRTNLKESYINISSLFQIKKGDSVADIVVGEIFSVPLMLVNVYGPNYDNPEFFKIVSYSTKIVNSSKLLNSYITNSNMFDVWRILYPTARDYSFHS